MSIVDAHIYVNERYILCEYLPADDGFQPSYRYRLLDKATDSLYFIDANVEFGFQQKVELDKPVNQHPWVAVGIKTLSVKVGEEDILFEGYKCREVIVESSHYSDLNKPVGSIHRTHHLHCNCPELQPYLEQEHYMVNFFEWSEIEELRERGYHWVLKSFSPVDVIPDAKPLIIKQYQKVEEKAIAPAFFERFKTVEWVTEEEYIQMNKP